MSLNIGISVALASIASSLLTRYLVKIAREKPLQAGNTAILQYGPRTKRLFLLVAIGTPILAAVLGMVRPPTDMAETYCWIGAVLLFVALGIPLLIETRVRVFIEASGLRSHSPWRRGERFISWKNVESVTYSKVNKWFVISSQDGIRIRASIYLQGIGLLVDNIRERLPAAAYSKAAIGFRIVEG